MKLYVYCLAYPVTALGPGQRVALWVSGCPLACKGCITPELWDSDAGQAVEVGRVLTRLLAMGDEIDGITLTGGEPFEQADALVELVAGLAELRPDWSVLAFSGYSLRELQDRGEQARGLLSYVDILIAGRYARTRPSSQALIASDNQRLHSLTSRGRSMAAAIEAGCSSDANLGLGPNGEKLLIGVLQPGLRQSIHDSIGAQAKTTTRSS